MNALGKFNHISNTIIGTIFFVGGIIAKSEDDWF